MRLDAANSGAKEWVKIRVRRHMTNQARKDRNLVEDKAFSIRAGIADSISQVEGHSCFYFGRQPLIDVIAEAKIDTATGREPDAPALQEWIGALEGCVGDEGRSATGIEIETM